MSEPGDLVNQAIRWDVNGIVLANHLRLYDATIAALSAGRPFEIDPRLPEGLRTLFASIEAWLATQAGLRRMEDQE